MGAPGKVRGPWAVILLSLLTLGIYGLFLEYMPFER